MRFSIRSQVLWPTSIIMVVAMVAVAVINTWIAQRAARKRIGERVEDVRQILQQATFPLTNRVLAQMSGLVGAEFVLMDDQGAILASSDVPPETALPPTSPTANGLGETLTWRGKPYFHRVMPLERSNPPGGGEQLHVLFDAHEYRRLWQRSLWPSLLVAGAALVAALSCAYWIGGSVSRSAQRIGEALRRIAAGEFKGELPSGRDDELRDVARQVHQTAGLLQAYEQGVRDTERMKTLTVIGAGLAHQLRNSATGCRMALDVHAQEHPHVDDEALQVARRQLDLMENYLQRFLRYAQVEPARDAERDVVDLNELVENAVLLARPAAKHLRVQLDWEKGTDACMVCADRLSLEQAIVNLVLNGVEAAAGGNRGGQGRVWLELMPGPPPRGSLTVADNGAGPDKSLDVFAPFASEKEDGVGLGLAVVREVCQEHEGRVHWRREENATKFILELPLVTEEADGARAHH